MRTALKYALVVVLVINLSLVAVSAYLANQSTQQYPMLGELIDVQGINLHVTDTHPDSQLPPLVLLHGASTSLLDFESSLKPLLQDTYRIISIDRPGHGYSERGNSTALASMRTGESTDQSIRSDSGRPSPTWVDPDVQARLVAAALDTLGVQESIWVGHSWAGSVVLAGLLDESLDVSAGVIIAGATHPWQGRASSPTEIAAKPYIGRLFSWQFIEPVGRFAMEAAIAEVFSPERVPVDYVESTGLVLSLRPETFRYNAIDRTRLSDFLVEQSTRYSLIDKPVLSITGSEDHVVPAWNHDARLALQVPQLQSVELDGAGHAPHHTRSSVVSELITSFTESLDATTGAVKAPNVVQ